MSMHLFYAPSSAPSSSASARELRLLCAYEDGGIVLRKRTAPENTQTIEGRGWEVLWKSKLHVESVMAMAVSLDCTFALTVSADHLVGQYDLLTQERASGFTSVGTAFKTKHPGNGAIAIRGDGRVCAVGGWDGKVRLYSTKTFKPLGTLVHHKQGCRAVTFASLVDSPSGNTPLGGGTNEDNSSDDEDEMTVEEKRARTRWLVAGSTDAKVSIWALMNFEKTSPWVSTRGSNTPSHSILHTNGNTAVTFPTHFGIGSPIRPSNQIYEIVEEVIDSNVYRKGKCCSRRQ